MRMAPMQPTQRRRPSAALVISIIALAFAIGGTSYAALKLPTNSVGTRQIKKNAVTSAKVKDLSLKRQDFAVGALPVGPKGDTGPPGRDGTNGMNGTNGTNGSARAYARVNGSTLAFSHSKNVTAVSRPVLAPAGAYCVSVSGADARTDVAVVSPDFATDSTNATGNAGSVAHVEWSSEA